jgi:hypothetical protein
MTRPLPNLVRFASLFALASIFIASARAVTLAADETDSQSTSTPLFSRHVAPLLSRLGCNGGTCHGAVQGKNGFRLSLFGASPAADYEQLVRAESARRINRVAPENSLLLLKATGQVAHGGGKVTPVGSIEYEILRRWIIAGAPLDQTDSSRVVALNVTPTEHTVQTGQRYSLRVEAKFADGSVEDVTQLCSFESLDTHVAAVAQSGDVVATGVGDTALIVRYRAEPSMTMIAVPRASAEAFPEVAASNFVDEHIRAKLRRLNIPPSALADDETFLRRLRLDVTGELSQPDEVRAFLADSDPQKRTKKIEQLLGESGHAAVWTLKFCDLLKAGEFGVYADAIKLEDDAPRFQQWVRARLEENLPYDQFVERILTATSREGRSVEEWAKEIDGLFAGATDERKDVELYSQRKTLDLYWLRGSASGVPGTLQVAHSFLGLRLECAQCHRHPHDVWQQDDLLSFANFFTRVRKPGFQGDNEKKFPELGAINKQLTEEAKSLAEQAKKMKEEKGKELDAKENEGLKKEVAEMERRSKYLVEVGRRVMHAEVRHLDDDATAKNFASVTSPLGTQSSLQFRLLGETEAADVTKDQDPRLLVAEWLRRPDNPFFAKAIVNRVWAHYFGRGIVDPPDNLSPFNPATHPELLDELCRQFIANRYDLKWLHRTILGSRTYQQSSMATAANEMDRANYAYFYYRRLPAEVLLDAMNQATGTSENMDMKYNHWPDKIKAVEIPYAPRNEFVKFMLEHFGRPERNSAAQCDCERDTNASVLQVLSFANHPRIRQKIADPSGHAARIVKEMLDDTKRIEETFLLTLGRLPDDGERDACLNFLGAANSPEEGLQAVMWSLLNTREFVLQH